MIRIACLLLLLAPALAFSEAREIEWLDLMPDDVAERWVAGQTAIDHSALPDSTEFQSFETVGTLDGQRVRLPGFVVPVETDEEGRLTEFFLVPYFGACIHVPPPPANQIVDGRLVEPIRMVVIWEAFLMEGVLQVEEVSNATADSAYSMQVEALRPY
ncbi:MAG: DUF3299 domain-containing protein [Wenzhouxiangellaceae bacterium]|nr:DUF3299 domain-containing protein [Wenzhouxiangellaceae bacterium]